MLAGPRCGNHAEYLSDEVFSLLRCEFCGEDLDAADLRLPQDADRIAHGLLPTSWEELLPPWKQSSSEALSAGGHRLPPPARRPG